MIMSINYKLDIHDGIENLTYLLIHYKNAVYLIQHNVWHKKSMKFDAYKRQAFG